MVADKIALTAGEFGFSYLTERKAVLPFPIGFRKIRNVAPSDGRGEEI
jgi:hypothetical protein